MADSPSDPSVDESNQRTKVQSQEGLNNGNHEGRAETEKKDRIAGADAGKATDTETGDAASEPAATPKPGIMAKLGLDAPTLIAMFKNGIAPTIGLAISQSDAVASEYTTVGYLVGIICVLSLTILPRGKFVQTLVLNVIFAGIGAATALLILWAALQARFHTQSEPPKPGAKFPPYNSSQSAVSAVMLFANIWLVNTLRAKYPSLNVPAIVYSILTNISCTYSPIITSVASAESIVRRILTAMLTGFGIAAACSLLILPIDSRKVTMAQMKGAIMLLRGAVKQEKAYLQSLEREDMFAVPADIGAGHGTDKNDDSSDVKDGANKNGKGEAQPNSTAEAKAIKDTVFKLRQLLGKLFADLPFAKRDIAWSKLEAGDLTHTVERIRGVVIPVVGMGTMIDIFQRLAEKRGWITTAETSDEVIAEKSEEKRVWNEVMKQLHEPFEQLSMAIDQGLEHAAMQLEILPRPKKEKKQKNTASGSSSDADVEAKGDLVQPGDPGFSEVLADQVRSFCKVRGEILRVWAVQKGLATDDSSSDPLSDFVFPQDDEKHRQDQEQLYLLLYLETLMQAAGQSVLQFVMFADQKVADGTMSKNRLLLPKASRVRKWIASIFEDEDHSEEHNADLFDSGQVIVYMGDSFAQKKDPEHLPATTKWQRMGDILRGFSRFISSEESMFGFRAACATLTIGVVAFLQDTYIFFIQQRLVWAMIIIAIGMTRTSGQSLFGFFCRVIGTVIAMVFSLIAWYIVDQKTPGILVFMYLFLGLTTYFVVKYPQFIPASLICMVTLVMIIGYELQVRVIGAQLAESSGQPVYPIYELAPYRLATVAAGCLVTFIWTIFPSPMTERNWLRRDLSLTLYLLANYFSAIHATLRARLRSSRYHHDPDRKGSPAHRLARHRRRLFGKLMLLLPALKQHADFQRWEPTVGGAFPRALYEDVVRRAARVHSYLTLMAYTVGGAGSSSSSLSSSASDADDNNNNSEEAGEERAWITALAALLADISPTQHAIISTLTLLSSALQSGHSLPPHLALPRPFELTRRLEALDQRGQNNNNNSNNNQNSGSSSSSRNPDATRLLDARNMLQPGYAEFAVLQVCSALVCDDLGGLVADVSELVGVVDFSYRVEARKTDANGKLKKARSNPLSRLGSRASAAAAAAAAGRSRTKGEGGGRGGLARGRSSSSSEGEGDSDDDDDEDERDGVGYTDDDDDDDDDDDTTSDGYGDGADGYGLTAYASAATAAGARRAKGKVD
ncbi:hypothetical protein F4780DRAFT_315402 [Xylariomycetidae sp. FL0641]|nr:hypothetical protein F4780DRAFT_315402 [Xylariomycetidae sp. FL0641]